MISSVGNGIELSDDIKPVSEGRTNQLMDLLPERENSGAPILNQKGIDYLLKHGLCNENEAKYLKALMSHKQNLLDPEANMNENLSQEDQELLKETLTDDDMEHNGEEEVKVEVNSTPKPSSRRRRKKSSTPASVTSTSTVATVVEQEEVLNDVSSTSHSENLDDDVPEEQEEKVKISTPFVFGASDEDNDKEDETYDKTSAMLQQMEELRLFDEDQDAENFFDGEDEENLENSVRDTFDGLF